MSQTIEAPENRDEIELQNRLEKIIADELDWLRRAARAVENGESAPKR